jgi:ketosteroid isomerase-like protein
MGSVDQPTFIPRDDRDAVRHANQLFYRALDSLDLATMDRVWMQTQWAYCVHAGGDAIVGWDAVRKSWERIFSSTSWIRVTPTGVRIEIISDVAVVTCAESIAAESEGDLGLAVAQATNLFRKTPEGWRLFHHHASSAPVYVTHPFSGTVQ